MRALSCVIALVFLLTGPSPADPADRDMPGVGPILNPAPDIMTAIGQ